LLYGLWLDKIIFMKERKAYNTTLRADLIKKLRILAAEQDDKRQNDLLEEAIEDLLKRYSKKGKK
jgi:hypothetical protein